MTTGYLTHRTLDGDRWDLLAFHYYGDALAHGHLLRANPEHARLPFLPVGLILRVPILEAGEIMPEPAGDVPWR